MSVGEKNQRMIRRVALVGVVRIVLEVVGRSLGVVFFEQATLTDFVIANPFM